MQSLKEYISPTSKGGDRKAQELCQALVQDFDSGEWQCPTCARPVETTKTRGSQLVYDSHGDKMPVPSRPVLRPIYWIAYAHDREIPGIDDSPLVPDAASEDEGVNFDRPPIDVRPRMPYPATTEFRLMNNELFSDVTFTFDKAREADKTNANGRCARLEDGKLLIDSHNILFPGGDPEKMWDPLHCQSLILVHKCDRYFERLLRNHIHTIATDKNAHATIPITDVHPLIFRVYVYWLHNGFQLPSGVSHETMWELYGAAKAVFKNGAFLNECILHLHNALRLDTIATCTRNAVARNVEPLIQLCYDYLAKHFEDVCDKKHFIAHLDHSLFTRLLKEEDLDVDKRFIAGKQRVYAHNLYHTPTSSADMYASAPDPVKERRDHNTRVSHNDEVVKAMPWAEVSDDVLNTASDEPADFNDKVLLHSYHTALSDELRRRRKENKPQAV